jgi:hypothetical protein
MTSPCISHPSPADIYPHTHRYGLAIASDGRTLFFADSRLHRIVEVDGSGALVRSWGRYGAAPGELDHPRGLTIHGNELIVADRGNNRLQVHFGLKKKLAGSGCPPALTQNGRARSGVTSGKRTDRPSLCTPGCHRHAIRMPDLGHATAFPPACQTQPVVLMTHRGSCGTGSQQW